MNALIIGFGKMGMLHAATLNTFSEIKNIMICEPSHLIQSGLKNFNAPFLIFDDLEKALASQKIDMAVIATPTSSHMSIFRRLMQNSLHTFIEKPMASNVEEASQCLDIWQKTNPQPKVMVGHCLRYTPTFQLVKKILDENALGQILSFTAEMYSPDVLKKTKGWRFKKGLIGGGVLLDLGSHLVDMVQYLFGMPSNVNGHVEAIFSAHVEDVFEAHFDYANFGGEVTASWSKPEVRKATLSIKIQGSAGDLVVLDDWVEFNLKEPWGDYVAGRNTCSITQLETHVPFDLAGPMYTRQLKDWTDSILGNQICQNDLYTNMNNMVLIEAIRESKRLPIKIQEIPNPLLEVIV